MAWKNTMRPKNQVGLGIIDLRSHKKVLLLKYLHKFYNKHNLPWVKLTWKHLYRNQNKCPHELRPRGSFQWRRIIKLVVKYFMMAASNVHEGTTVSFWNDLWNFGVLKTMHPHLHYSFISKHVTFKGYLSLEALAQLTALQEQMLSIHLDPMQQDVWIYIWGLDFFSCKNSYLQLIGIMETSPWYMWMWKSCCPRKHKLSLKAKP